MRNEVHIHKLKRHRFKTGSSILYCTGANCSYKVAPQLALGKLTLCWRCDKPFTLDDYTMRLAKPHCRNCQKKKSGGLIEKIEPEMASATVNDLRSRLSSVVSLEKEDEEL